IPTATSTQTPGPTPTEAVAGLVQPEEQDDGVPLQQDPTQPAPATGGDNTGVTSFEATATQLILDATAAQAMILTQEAATAGIGNAIPTNTPTPDAVTDPGLGDGQGVVATQPPVAIQPGADCVHEVRAVDRSLYRLSLAYGVTVNQIAAASGIVNPDLIRIGQRLTIPGCGTTGGRPPATSTPGPNDNNIGGPGVAVVPGTDCTFGTSVLFPGGCPDGSTPNTSGSVGTTTGTGVAADTGGPTTGTGSGTVVRVQQGETLFEISLRTGVPVASIAAANGITDFDRIFLNQELIIP
ncbi:MAG: LysM peptidoglycan-binding domain-containing protein, partial [Chloroflexota bacterium]